MDEDMALCEEEFWYLTAESPDNNSDRGYPGPDFCILDQKKIIKIWLYWDTIEKTMWYAAHLIYSAVTNWWWGTVLSG